MSSAFLLRKRLGVRESRERKMAKKKRTPSNASAVDSDVGQWERVSVETTG